MTTDARAALTEALDSLTDAEGSPLFPIYGHGGADVVPALLAAMPGWRLVPADELAEMQRRIDRWEERALGFPADAVPEIEAAEAALATAEAWRTEHENIWHDADAVPVDAERICPDCGLSAARIGDIHINAQEAASLSRLAPAPSEPD